MWLEGSRGPEVEHLRLELDLLLALLTVRLREMQAVGLLPAPEDPQPGQAVYLQEVEARLATEALAPPSNPRIEAAARRLEDAKAQRDRFLAQEAGPMPLDILRRRFGLQEAEFLLLLLVAAPSFDPRFGRLYAFLQNHFERPFPTLGLLLDVLVAPGEAASLHHLLDDDGPLLGRRLVRLYDVRPHLPRMVQPLRLDERVARFLVGEEGLDARLRGVAREERAEGELWLPQDERVDWERLVAEVEGCGGRAWELPIVALRGPGGVGRRRRALDLARRLGAGVLSVDLAALARVPGGMAEGAALLRREATLLGAGLALEGWERLGSRHDGDEPGGELRAQDDARAALERALDGFTGPLLWIGHDEDEPVPWRERGVWSHRARLPEPALAQRIWVEALGREGKRLASELHTLARDFRLPPGSIAEAAQEARARAQRLAKPLDLASLATAARAQLRHRLGAQATRVENAYRWEDLILSEELRAQLEELIARFKHRDRVLRDWGLGRRFGQELGLSALFEGPPGTGKTMSASLVAQALQRELFQVDLSRIVSRYVGETEKNLSRIFDEAEQAQAILLFDEADSLFAKRTEVRSSNDRYANLEVNYLLQRVERFSGVAILTTNFAASIDEAFARRLSMRVRFPKPEAEERQRLWSAMLSEQRLPRGEVDCRDLGLRFELTGGTIRNAVLRAAFLAASRGGVLDQDLLDLAARLELKAQGTLVEGNPYDDLRAR